MSLPAFFLVNAVWLKVIKTRSKQMATKVCCCFKIGNKTLKWCVVHIYFLFARVCITFLGIYMFFIFYNKYTYVFYIYIYKTLISKLPFRYIQPMFFVVSFGAQQKRWFKAWR